MAQVNADPEDIRIFALQLDEFSGLLDEALLRLNGQFARLGDTWQDHEHERFAEQFVQTVRMLHQFQEAAADQIPFLQRKAELLDIYHQR